MGKIAKTNDKQTSARSLKWMGMFIGKTPIDELRKTFHIGTSNEDRNFANKFCMCKKPEPKGVAIARYCWKCKKDLK